MFFFAPNDPNAGLRTLPRCGLRPTQNASEGVGFGLQILGTSSHPVQPSHTSRITPATQNLLHSGPQNTAPNPPCSLACASLSVCGLRPTGLSLRDANAVLPFGRTAQVGVWGKGKPVLFPLSPNPSPLPLLSPPPKPRVLRTRDTRVATRPDSPLKTSTKIVEFQICGPQYPEFSESSCPSQPPARKPVAAGAGWIGPTT